MQQASLPGFEPPSCWVDEEVVVPVSGRPLRLKYVLVKSAVQLDTMEAVLVATRDITHDTETSGLVPALGARVIGHAFAAQTGPAEISLWYIPIRHLLEEGQLDAVLVSQVVARVLAAQGRCGWAHGKFDWGMCRADGIATIERERHDVLVLANAANENEPSFGLKGLAARHCLAGAKDDEEALDKWMKTDARGLGLKFKKRAKVDLEAVETLGEPTYLERFGYARTPIEMCGRYACRDVFYTLYLWLIHYAAVPTAFHRLYQREMRVAECLHEMEWVGLPLDDALVRKTHDWTSALVRHWLGEVRRLVGDNEFLPTDAAVRKLLYEDYKLTAPKWTKGGASKTKQTSVDREARKLLSVQHPEHAVLFDALGNLAKASKYHTTYAVNFLRYYDGAGRIHPSYNQLDARDERGTPVTGRLSSQAPNVQNITRDPIKLTDEIIAVIMALLGTRDEEPLAEINVRRYFGVPKGYVRFYIDFSQIELRVLAWFCQDPNLLRAYRENLDVHQMTMDMLSLARPIAKQVNFLTIYGGTENALALRMPGYFEDPDGTRVEAKRILDAFFAKYTGIKLFEARFAAEMRRNHNEFVSPFGRPRRIPEISSPQKWERQAAQRKMMSSIISGTAADLMKECMLRTSGILRERSPRSYLAQSVHDELVFDLWGGDDYRGLLGTLIENMELWPMFSDAGPSGLGQGVPIQVSCAWTTTTWADKKEVERRDGAFDFSTIG